MIVANDTDRPALAPSADPTWLTVDEAAQRARVGRAIIYHAISSGALKAARAGRLLRLRPIWVDQWLEQSAEADQIVVDRLLTRRRA